MPTKNSEHQDKPVTSLESQANDLNRIIHWTLNFEDVWNAELLVLQENQELLQSLKLLQHVSAMDNVGNDWRDM